MENFDEWAHEETQRIIKQHTGSFSPDAPLQAAAIFGGAALVAAIDPDAIPICPRHLDCSKCDVGKYCWHKVLTKEERAELMQTYEDANIFADDIDNMVSQIMMTNSSIRQHYEGLDDEQT